MAADNLYVSDNVVYIKSEGNAVQADDGTYIYYHSGDSSVGTGASYGGSTGGLAGSTPVRITVPTKQIARSVTLSVAVTDGIALRANKNTVSVTKCATVINDGTVVNSRNWTKQFPSVLQHSVASDSTVLEASGFGFNIPVGADIVGIEVDVTRSSGGSVASDDCQLFLSKWFDTATNFGVLVGSWDAPEASASADAGATWNSGATQPGYWVNSLAANADGSVLIAATWEDADGVGGLYRSTNKGVSWTKLTPGASVPTIGTEVDSGLASFTNSLFTIFDKSDKVWSSADGFTWTEHTNGPRPPSHLVGESMPIYYWSTSSRYYSAGPCDATMSGLYTSTDLNTWTKVTDLETGSTSGGYDNNKLYGHKVVGDGTNLLVIAPNSDSGSLRVWQTSGTGSNPTMTDVTPVGAVNDCVNIATDGSGRFMVGLDDGNIQYSDNAGSTWSGNIDVIPANTKQIRNTYYNAANSQWIVAVEDSGIYTSGDGGDTWSKANDWPVGTDVHSAVFWEE